jgi:hypothetical protein
MSVAIACSDASYDPVGCDDPLCAYGDCNTNPTDPIDVFTGNPGAVGLAGIATQDHGGTAISNGGNSLTSIFGSIAATVAGTSAALNAPKPTSGVTLPGIGSIGTFGSSGLFLFALIGIGVWYLAKKA